MKYYCIGIKGSGMSTLACILHDLGNNVTGYDDARGYKFTMDGLNERNIEIFYDEHDIDKDTIVTFSRAFSEDHKEIKRVKELGLTIRNYNDVLGDITKMFDTVSVCGTHGKTTTSLMISNILENTVGCNYFVGDGSGKARKENKYFVIESDEFNKHFLAYSPTIALITNIELDHTECYPGGIDEIKDTFRIFGNKAKYVIACGDDINIKDVKFDKEVLYYGFDKSNDVYADNIEFTSTGSKFDVYINNELFDSYDLPLFGKHMVSNAIGTIALCNYLNISKEDIKKYLSTFKGAKRRFKEEIINDYIIIDDYAHHPTEIEVTLKACRQKYPDKELVSVFLPNTYSRTEALKDDFIKALSLSDKSYIMDIYCDREKREDYPNISSDVLIENIDNAEKISVDTVDKLLKHKNSVICFMSCTNIYVILNKFKEIIE